jgi:hypothetical protein
MLPWATGECTDIVVRMPHATQISPTAIAAASQAVRPALDRAYCGDVMAKRTSSGQ